MHLLCMCDVVEGAKERVWLSDIRIFFELDWREIYQAKGHSHSHLQNGGHRTLQLRCSCSPFSFQILNHYRALLVAAERSLDEEEPGISPAPRDSNSLRNLVGEAGRLHRMRMKEILKISCKHLTSALSPLSTSFEPVDLDVSSHCLSVPHLHLSEAAPSSSWPPPPARSFP